MGKEEGKAAVDGQGTAPDSEEHPHDGGQGEDDLGTFKSVEALMQSYKEAQRKITELGEKVARISEDNEQLLQLVNTTVQPKQTQETQDDLDLDLDLGLGADVKALRQEFNEKLENTTKEIGTVLGGMQLKLLKLGDPDFKEEYLVAMKMEAEKAPYLVKQGMTGLEKLYERAKKTVESSATKRAEAVSKLSLEALEELGIDTKSLPRKRADKSTSPKAARPGDTKSVADPKIQALRKAKELAREGKGIDAVLEARWAGRPSEE